MKINFVSLSTLSFFLFVSSTFAQLNVELTIDNTKTFSRTEPVSSGIPISEASNLLNTATLRVVNSNGQDVPADFTVLGRWNAPPTDTSRPIKWVLVQFDATVGAQTTSTYYLRNDGAGGSTNTMSINETGSTITVSTGPARFVLTKGSFNLFSEVYLDLNQDGSFGTGEQVVLSSTSNGPFVEQSSTEFRATGITPISISIEEQGAVRSVVRVEGFHRNGSTNLLRYVTRLFFYAGKSYVKVHHTIIEGRVDGQGNMDYPQVFMTTFTRGGIRTQLDLTSTATVRIRGGSAVQQSTLSSQGSLEQSRVSGTNRVRSYSIAANGSTLETGETASQAWLDISDPRAGLAVTTQHFAEKSPQRLAASSNGTIEINFPSQSTTIYQAMGLGEKATLYFHGPSVSNNTLQTVMEGFAADPLFLRTTSAWNRASNAFDQLAPYPAPAAWTTYDTLMDGNFSSTQTFISEHKSDGIMNYLGMPTDQYDNTTDPDAVSWGNSYYDPGASTLREYARRSDIRWLKEIAFPLMEHWYTTDMYDTDQTSWYQNGISGSRGVYHRGAWTGEYHYMWSLWLYYYMTGDRRALERGLQSGLTYATSPNWANDSDIGLGYAGLTTRMYGQKFSTMTDAWLATGNSTIKNALDTQIPEYLNRFFTAEGFVCQGVDLGDNPYGADQGWMATQMLHPGLYRYYLATSNSTVRNFLVTAPARVDQYHRVSSDTSSNDYFRFYNVIRVTSGGGGNITSTTPLTFGGDDFFYNTERPGFALALYRAASISGDQSLSNRATGILNYALNTEGQGSSLFDKPSSKFAQYLAAAVGFATASDPDSTVPTTPTATPIPNNPNSPTATPTPPSNNDFTIWGFSVAKRGAKYTFTIGANNIPSNLKAKINSTSVNFRTRSNQITISTNATVVKKRSKKNISKIIFSRNSRTLVTISYNLKTNGWSTR